MANWSQSHLLQSLGWAILNSFWQMALLWCIFSVINFLFRLSSHKKYQLSVGAVAIGFAWFVFTFVLFFQTNAASGISFFYQAIHKSESFLNVFLFSASVAYLSLLIFPSYKLFKNWLYVRRIKKHGLQKANAGYRLFVQKIAAQLDIRKKVFVYLSELVTSPLTVGYLKPVILLPVAALNNLSVQQVEAILLHELSHIRRYDYVVNFIISIISTLLYFNPFVKLFVKNIEEERENCCDQLVLQYGYDKVGYASALLNLEKFSLQQSALAMGAVAKKHLLNRIEKITGIEKKKTFKKNQFAGLLAAFFCVVIFNSVLIGKEKKKTGSSFTYSYIGNPLRVFETNNTKQLHYVAPARTIKENRTIVQSKIISSGSKTKTLNASAISSMPKIVEPLQNPDLVNVVSNDINASLTKDQKDKVKATVDATRKVLSNLQWKEVENAIADAMNVQEKIKAKQEYLKKLDNVVNWKNIEQNMKARYAQIDWNKVNAKLNNALTAIQLDSLQKNYAAILTQIEIANADANSGARVNATPLPDQSLEVMKKSADQLRKEVEALKTLRHPKKIVSL